MWTLILLTLTLALPSIVTTVCVTVIRLQPYRLVRRFGDVAASSTGDKAQRAQELARDYSRPPIPDGEPASVQSLAKDADEADSR